MHLIGMNVIVKGIKQYVHVDLSKKESIDQAMKELSSHIDSYFGIAGVSGMKMIYDNGQYRFYC